MHHFTSQGCGYCSEQENTVNKELVFNHCHKSLHNNALNDLRHQRKQIITASD